MIFRDRSTWKQKDALCELNMEQASQEELLAWLSAIIESETDKPEAEQDRALIEECILYMDELMAEEVVCSEEELQARLVQIKAQAVADAEQEAPRARILPMKQKCRRRLVKSMIAVAACLCLLLSGISVAANWQEEPEPDSFAAFLKRGMAWLRGKEPGETYTEGNTTLVQMGEVITYPSLRALMESGKHDCMVYNYLPEGIKLEEIIEERKTDTRYKLIFDFDQPTVMMSICNYEAVSNEALLKYPSYRATNLVFYIIESDGASYRAIGYANGYEYQVACTDYNELIKILDSMKGMTP